MIRLTKQQILLLHRDIVEASGGSPEIRDEGLLESAICTPFQTFADAELYPSLLEKAAQDPEIGIVPINRTLASLCSEEIGAFRKSHSLPAVTEIPDRSSDGSGNSIADYVSEAIGIKI